MRVVRTGPFVPFQGSPKVKKINILSSRGPTGFVRFVRFRWVHFGVPMGKKNLQKYYASRGAPWVHMVRSGPQGPVGVSPGVKTKKNY